MAVVAAANFVVLLNLFKNASWLQESNAPGPRKVAGDGDRILMQS